MTVFAVGLPIVNAWASRKALLRISASIELATDAWPYASAAGWVAEMQTLEPARCFGGMNRKRDGTTIWEGAPAVELPARSETVFV